MDFGNLIKSKRKELDLTQKELAEGICTQALISRIEKGDIVPQNSILQQLGSRLQLDDNELNNLAYKTRYDNEMFEIKKKIRKALTRRDYVYIEEILEQNKILISNTNNQNDQAFFTWMKASLQDKLYHQKDKALKILTEIPLLHLEDEIAIEILNAIGVIYYQGEEFKEALNVFQHAVNMIEDNIDYMVQTKLLFNYALTLEEFDEDKKALDYIIQAIERLIFEDSMYLLGDLYHTKGSTPRKLGHLQEAKKISLSIA